MNNFLNLGNEKFQESIDSAIYVDKTGLIEYTNKAVSTRQRFICVARPRRFGKTMAAEMLEAYYCRGCDSHAQFDALQISKTEKYETHMNKYNVVHINVVDFINKRNDTKTGLAKIEKLLINDFKNEYPDISYTDDSDVILMIKDIFSETKIKFVFLIDEWDSPLREQKSDTDGHDDYLVFLRSLFKDQEYVALAYMTGILPIKKFCTNSSLNMFQEFSMGFPGPVKQYFGFTDGEVKALCAERGFSYDGIRDWYDGYVFENKPGEDLHMYNSNSVVSAILDNQLMSYWPRTESFEDLKQYIRLNKDDLHDVLTELLCGDTYPIREEMFFEDDTSQRYLNKILKHLVNLGYLAYDSGESSVYIPNLEVKREFIEVISDMGDDPLSKLLRLSSDILDVTLKKDGGKLTEFVAKFHETCAPTRTFNDEATLAYVLKLAYISACSKYRIDAEAQAGKGYADLIFMPYDAGRNLPMVTELKYNKTADKAIGQIEDRHYVRYFDKFAYRGDILFVGINYDSGTDSDGSDGTYTVRFETVKI